MKLRLVLAFIFLFGIKFSNAQWNIININTGYNLSKVIFVNDSVGYIIGDSIYGLNLSGKVFKTTNRGLNWTQTTWDLRSFTDIDFVNADTGFISCTDGTTTYTKRTFNGGISWININTKAPNGPQHFISSTVGFATKNVANGVELFKTNDGALNWDSTSIIGSASAVQDLQFINDSIGFVGGLYGPLMAQYNLASQQINLIGSQMAAVRKIQFFNADTGYFAAFDFTNNMTQFYFTSNGGANFGSMYNMAQFGLSLTDEINSFHCFDVNHCMCATSSANVIVGIGNNLWWLESTPASSISSIFTTPDFTIAVGANGTVMRRAYITGIENEMAANISLKCYPTITTDFINIESTAAEKINLSVFDVHGKMIFEQKEFSKQTQLDFRKLPTGLYFIVAENKNSRKTFKVIKQ